MSTIGSLAQLARLIGEPARAAMLVELMDGRALTAGELARVAGVGPSTASGHLAGLREGGLLAVSRQGRHHYYHLASTSVGSMLETLMGASALAANPRRMVTGPKDEAMRQARTCYDHLAGTVAVEMASKMVERGQLELADEAAVVTAPGLEFLARMKVDLAQAASGGGSRPGPVFCRPCLDWSERRPHLGGTLGARIYEAFLAQRWIRPQEGSRAVVITPSGRTALRAHFGVAV